MRGTQEAFRTPVMRANGTPGSSIVFAFLATVAAVVVVCAVTWGIMTVVARLAADTVSISMPLANGETPDFTAKSPVITHAVYSEVWTTFAGVDGTSTWLLLLAALCGNAMFAGVGVAALVLCMRLIRGKPFAATLTWATVASALIIAVCGIAAQTLEAAGQQALVDLVGTDLTAGGNLVNPSYEGFVYYGLGLDLTPVFVGIGLLVVAAAFSYGRRLQRDTEGLV